MREEFHLAWWRDQSLELCRNPKVTKHQNNLIAKPHGTLARFGQVLRPPLVDATILASLILAAGCSDSGRLKPEMAGEVVRIVATDHGYELPDRVAAGLVHLTFENRGAAIHEAMFIKLPDDMTAEDYLAAVKGGSSFPAGALDCSGPGLTSPGERVELWLNLDPGRYLLGCWFREHLISKPAQTLEVHESNSASAPPPTADVTLRLIDFRFEFEGRLRAGTQTIRIQTPGPSMHEVDIFRLKKGRTIEDLRQWQKEGKRGDAPAVAIGGILDSHDLSRDVWLRANFQRGPYVLWCGMAMIPDSHGPAADMTHADAGMFTEFRIED